MRDRLIELIQKSVDGCARHWAEVIADYLLANGVIVPTVALKQNLFVLEDIGIQTLPEITQVEVFRIHFTVASGKGMCEECASRHREAKKRYRQSIKNMKEVRNYIYGRD